MKEKGKRIFYCELAYVFGLLLLGIGTALMEKADFGLSMVVAPAYLIHLKVSKFLPFFSFGMSSYVFQAILLTVLSLIMRKVKKSYFLSFGTAFLYGFILDGMIAIVALLPLEGIAWQFVCYALGMTISAVGLSLLFRTYFPPEAYDLFVKELAKKANISLGKIKLLYDCCSCTLAIVLSLCFFGGFVGVNWGTVVCALLNGFLIGCFGRLFEQNFEFKDALPLRENIN